ncbi:MAG: DUF1761 domain-containing protein [Cyclobacteriaceae bacterium]|nr:DUF1761 domain-containing protein [Cyclobacteriaceae bacterium]
MEISYLGVLVAAFSSFIIGGVWYSPLLFHKTWAKENGFKDEDLKGGNMAKIFGLSFIASLIISVNLAAFLGPGVTLSWGTAAGALAGLGWVAMAYGVTYLFERKSFKLWLINAGYHVITFTLMGSILALMS